MAPRLSSFVAYLAADGGFFEQEGLEVELVAWENAADVIPLLAQGRVDVSPIWRLEPAYLNLIARGGRIRLVAGGAVYAPGECGYSAFIARNELLDSGRLGELSGLRGLRITSERTSSSYYVWSRLLASAGLSMAEVELVEMPTSARVEALAGGVIDVTTASEPYRSEILKAGSARIWKPVAEILPGRQSSYLVFGRRLLDERRDLGERFLRAYQAAVRNYVEEGLTDRLIEIVAGRTHLAPDALRGMCWPTYAADGAVDRPSVDEFQAWAKQEGLVDQIVPFDEVVDGEFLRIVLAGER